MTVWNDSFEASPADTDDARYGASKIRELKTAISEREELEHNFKLGTRPFHKAGKCSVVYYGTTTAIDALSGMSQYSIAFDTTLNVFKYFDGSDWVATSLDHGQLANLTEEDDHPQYLKLDKEGQTLSENLACSSGVTIDGRDLSADLAKLDSLVILDSGSLSLTFVASSKEIQRSSGSWITDGFAAGDIIYTTVEGNRGPFVIASVATLAITVYDTISDGSDTGVVFEISGGLGTWGGSYSVATTYGPEEKDCFIVAAAATSGSYQGYLYGYVGWVSPPTYWIMSSSGGYTSSRPVAITFPVTKGQYWQVVAAGTVPPTVAYIYRSQVT